MIVTGGWSGEVLLDSVELWSPHSGHWTSVDGWRLSQARYQHCSASHGHHSLIIAGGYPTLSLVQVLSLADHQWQGWTDLQPMMTGRAGHACVITNIGLRPVLIVSGGHNNGQLLQSVEALYLDDDEAAWLNMQNMIQRRRHHIMTVLDNSLLLIGGDTEAHQPMRGFYYQLVEDIESLEITENANEMMATRWKVRKTLLSPRTLLSHVKINKNLCS